MTNVRDKVIHTGSKAVNAGAGAYRLAYEPGHAVVTMPDGKVLVIKAGGDEHIIHLAPGATPTVKLIAGRLGMHPIADA